MERFVWADLLRRRAEAGVDYLEFLKVPSLRMGVYVLPAGGVDPQEPHDEDEVYYVVSGRARFRDGDEERAVAPGDVLFVPAGRDHRFTAIEEELSLVVFFARDGSESPKKSKK